MIRLPFLLFFSAILFSAGVFGVLARKNAVRNPRRTAAPAVLLFTIVLGDRRWESPSALTRVTLAPGARHPRCRLPR